MSERKKKYSTEHDEEIPYNNENIPNNYQYQDESIQHSVPYYQNVRYDDRFQNNYHDEYNYRFNSYMEQPRYDPRYDSRPLHYSHEYAAYDRPGGMVNQEIIKSPVEEETSELESSLMKKTCKTGRKKIRMAYIEGKNKRSVTFSKRKKGIMKKAYELNMLTKSQILLLVASESGHVYTFATPKLKPIISKHENLIQQCLNAPGSPDKSKYLLNENDNQEMREQGHLYQRQDFYDGYDHPSRDYGMDDRK